MLRTKLLTAAAATALLAGPAFAQEATQSPAPAAQPAPAPAATPAPAAAQANNVVDVLRAQGNFTTLLTALDQAQLTETLSTRPAITIFAPTDAAFAALPEADRTRLLDPANAQELRSLLLYHVIVADVQAGQIAGARGGVETAARTQVLLDGTGDAIKVDGATVTNADIDASNGGVYVIDKVLNPAQSQAAMGDEEAAAPAATTTEAPADEAAPTEAPASTEAPAATETPTPNPTGVTETTRPASPGATAPNGEPSAMTTTVQSPPVQNPTDGQVDDQEDPANPAPTPTPN
ncbi:fasciclin domain-containing protein [Brevundimonas sp.]|uniref:fasciclin domain-containing protein n=1 Tax=Brevundimonas sp. TaxID=1871086 RepID=UPI003F6E65A8